MAHPVVPRVVEVVVAYQGRRAAAPTQTNAHIRLYNAARPTQSSEFIRAKTTAKELHSPSLCVSSLPY